MTPAKQCKPACSTEIGAASLVAAVDEFVKGPAISKWRVCCAVCRVCQGKLLQDLQDLDRCAHGHTTARLHLLRRSAGSVRQYWQQLGCMHISRKHSSSSYSTACSIMAGSNRSACEAAEAHADLARQAARAALRRLAAASAHLCRST